MANLPELAEWTAGIYQLEEEDPVLGGENGIDNLQAKQLANRTLWLKALVELAAPKASPALTGNPTAPTQNAGDNSTKIANTAFVQAAIASLVNSAPAALDTLHELASALGNDANFAATINTLLASKASLSSPALTDVPTAPTAAPGTNTLQLANTAFVQAAIASLSSALSFTGQIAFFPTNTAPSGWLKANGAAISRTSYANLFALIGTAFGAGNGSTTFNLPDLRGEFLRGWDDGRGVDAGRVLGQPQADEIKSHSHKYGNTHNPLYGLSATAEIGVNPNTAVNYNTSSTGGAETRPRNVSLLACIKY